MNITGLLALSIVCGTVVAVTLIICMFRKR